MIEEFISKEFRLCDLVDRKQSVIYKEIDLDKLISNFIESADEADSIGETKLKNSEVSF